MFYLNRTSTESMFSDAQIYENMNRIVKMIDYKPVGRQTSTLSFNASALGTGTTQDTGLYTIPRYSFFQVNGISYSFNEDITFVKTVSGQTGAWHNSEIQFEIGKMIMNSKYEIIIFWSQEDDAFIAEVPELAGCKADGKTYQEALSNAEQVIQEWIETAKELGRTIPQPKGRLTYAWGNNRGSIG